MLVVVVVVDIGNFAVEVVGLLPDSTVGLVAGTVVDKIENYCSFGMPDLEEVGKPDADYHSLNVVLDVMEYHREIGIRFEGLVQPGN